MNILQIIPCTKDVYVLHYHAELKERRTDKVVCFALIENNRGDQDSKKVVGMIAGYGIQIAEFKDTFDGYTDTPCDNR